MQTAGPVFSCHKATAAGTPAAAFAPAAAFLPSTRAEMDALGWQQCDVIIVTGDAADGLAALQAFEAWQPTVATTTAN